MSKIYYKAFTYKPKIPAVWSGECEQTIRFISLPDHSAYNPKLLEEKKIKEGDEIVWYQWSGRPYCSKWLNRLLTTTDYAPIIKIYKEGIVFRPEPRGNLEVWKDLDWLAELDHVEGGGKGMGELFNKRRLAGINVVDTHPSTKKYAQIIRWDGSKIRSVA